jgi:hypothetical protein
MHWTAIPGVIACLIGGGLGAYAMVNPKWASNLVRLVPAEGKVEGSSEFRATYGGLFFLPHAFLAWALISGRMGSDLAAAVMGIAWLGSGLGRLLSMALDKTATGLNWFNVGFEFVLALALLSPLLIGAA